MADEEKELIQKLFEYLAMPSLDGRMERQKIRQELKEKAINLIKQKEN